MTSPAAYPLTWPAAIPRAKTREKSRFKVTLPAALKNAQNSLKLFGEDSNRPVKNVVISSNCTLGSDRPADPGVAIWFTWDDLQLCIPVDRYQTATENLQAIYHILEAKRVELRHGTLALVRASFLGLKALPAPEGKYWLDVMNFPPLSTVTLSMVEARFKELAAMHHPDKGGDQRKFDALVKARDQARRDLQ